MLTHLLLSLPNRYGIKSLPEEIKLSWKVSFDGFYLTHGHHSNNSTATLHDISTDNRSKAWSSKNNDCAISQQLIGKMGKDCTKKTAIRLHENGITYDHLHWGFKNCSSEQEFDKWLHNEGIRLKNWRKILHHHFSSTVPYSR